MDEDPAPLQPLIDFANTINVEDQQDDFRKDDDFAPGSPDARAAMRAWLVERALISPADAIDEAGYGLVMSLRATLRELFMANHDVAPAPAAFARLNEIASQAPVVAQFSEGAASLEPATEGARGAVGRLVAMAHAAMSDGTWPRLKLCRAETCQWAYFDASKNRSRNWCSMGVCGNRAKVRAYQARRRGK